MKILLVSQYFWPETFRVNDLAQELSLRGNDVTVLTGKPNYPQGTIYKGYRFWGCQTESFNSVKVLRVPILPRGKGSGLRLALIFLLFFFPASMCFSIEGNTMSLLLLLYHRLLKFMRLCFIKNY